MNAHLSNPDQWKRLLRAWPRIHPWQRKSLILHARCSLITSYWSLPFPVAFSLRATFVIFALLVILPHHPMSIPAAAGGGLAFALLAH